MRNYREVCRQLKMKFIHLNFFDSDRCRTDPFHLRTAIISTRIYIFLLVVIATIMIVSNLLNNQTESITIRNPSQTNYEFLLEKYPKTLSCRCRQTAIPFKNFTRISIAFHPICLSRFISNEWIELVFEEDIGYYFQLDFRSIASGHFQLLASLCKLAKQTVNDALEDFLSSTLLSVQVLSPRSLQIQTEAQSLFIQKSSADTVRRLIDLIRDTTYVNQLQTARQTTGLNRLYIFPEGDLGSDLISGCYFSVNDYNIRCCCYSKLCSAPAGFYDLFAYETAGAFVQSNATIANVSGFLGGCYALESLLHSNFECLFDRTCLDEMLKFFPRITPSNIDILPMNQTKFSPRTTINTLINELFLEHWTSITSFANYYTQCAPMACTYTSIRKNSFVYSVTTMIGLYGGLTVILRFCVPHGIQWYRNRMHRRRISNAGISSRERIRTIYGRMKTKMTELNIYTTSHQQQQQLDAYETTTARISTRVYLFFLILSITNLIIFTSLQTDIHTNEILNPSIEIFENLHKKYSSTLQCSCTQISINYGSFISLSPRYHPICSSEYLSNEWINSIEGTPGMNWYYQHEDFHVFGQSFFLTISTLCSTAQSTLNGTWFIFNHSTLITEHVLSKEELFVRVNTTLDQFESNTIKEFQRLFTLIQLHTKTMLSAKRTNIEFYTQQTIDDVQNGERIDFKSVTLRHGTCLCSLDDQCGQQMAMYSNGIRENYEIQFYLPEMFVGCFTMQSVLRSTLECFFNQTCLDAVQTEIFSTYSINISILDVNMTRFAPNTPIRTMMNALMIEEWRRTIRYEEYFHQCASRLCTYTTSEQKNRLYILTKLISLIGGLTIVLKIIVSIVVRRIRKWTRENDPLRVRPILNDRIRASCSRLKHKLINLNIFTHRLTVDVHRHYAGIITTRLYFFFLILASTILIICTLIEKQTFYVTILHPSQRQFERLQSDIRYASTLDCPCRQISISYEMFISIRPQLHQLCSSEFVQPNSIWIQYVYAPYAAMRYPSDDFRLFIVPELQSLFSLCTLANETLTDALILFMSNTFTNVHVQTRETIERHINESVQRFRRSTPRTFVRLLDYIRQIAQGNGIVSSIFSNWYFISLSNAQHHDSLWGEPRSYNNRSCSCGTNATCTSPAYIEDWRVPGFFVGCYPFEALLQSTLECLYDVTCIDRLTKLYYISNITMTPLDPRRSNPNVTVQSLLDELLIDQWTSEVIYEKYYSTCKPLSCSYLTSNRAHFLLIINTIVGLFGGLSVVFRLIAPVLISVLQRLITRYQQRQITVVVSVISTTQ